MTVRENEATKSRELTRSALRFGLSCSMAGFSRLAFATGFNRWMPVCEMPAIV